MAIPLVASIVTALLANNLPKVAQAVVDKGIDYVEDKLGLEIKPDAMGNLAPELVQQLQMRSMQHEEFKIEQEYKNLADARALQRAALEQDDLFSKRFVYYFISFWSIIGAGYIFAITFMTIPEANQRIADMTSGFMLGTVLAAMFQYLLGSSFGSNLKNKIFAGMKGARE